MNIEALNDKCLAAMFDHTLLKPYAQREDFVKLCSEAAANGFAMVAINSSPVSMCKELLRDTPVHVGAAISFPLGQTETAIKVSEARLAIDNGADEIDYVINIGRFKQGELSYTENEMHDIVELCRRRNVISKVIFENCYLQSDEIEALCRIALRVGPDYVKTSTGFGTGGATVEDVKRMKQIVGDSIKVKAAGGIRSWESCRAMIEAGAERIGTSSSLKILDEFRRQQG